MNLSKSLGLLFFSKPLDAIDPVSDEDDARVDEILAIMANSAAQPVFVHCEHGVDRTGLIIALYEVKYMGMSPDDAYNEWRASGHKGIGTVFTGHLDEYYWRKLGLLIPVPMRPPVSRHRAAEPCRSWTILGSFDWLCNRRGRQLPFPMQFARGRGESRRLTAPAP